MNHKQFNDVFILNLLKQDGYSTVALESVPALSVLLEEYMANDLIWDKSEREEEISIFFDWILNPGETVEHELSSPSGTATDMVEDARVKLVGSETKVNAKIMD